MKNTTIFTEVQVDREWGGGLGWHCEKCEEIWRWTEEQGHPKENKCRFCQYCGSEVVEFVDLVDLQ